MSLAEIAYESIKESLLKMDLTDPSVEERIDERGLAKKLGVSRTPLREAINRLVMEGFLKVAPRKGVYVVKKTKEEIIEILLVRVALEGMAARLATKNATDKDIRRMRKIFSSFNVRDIKGQFSRYLKANVEFHNLILKMSQCGKLIDVASPFSEHMRWINDRSAGDRERLPKAHQEHLQIVEAIERRDPDLAERTMRLHIWGLAQYIEENMDFPA